MKIGFSMGEKNGDELKTTTTTAMTTTTTTTSSASPELMSIEQSAEITYGFLHQLNRKLNTEILLDEMAFPFYLRRRFLMSAIEISQIQIEVNELNGMNADVKVCCLKGTTD